MGLHCPMTVKAGMGMAAAAGDDKVGILSVGVVGRAVVSGTVVDAVNGRFPDNACCALIVSMVTTTG